MEKIKKLINSRWILLFIILFALCLRLWRISEVPVSLFSDELDVGYQAYSLIKTGKDYMGNSLPLYFHSYADFRTPFYIYTAVPTVFVFGITPLGIRLPAVIFGVMGVGMMYLLVKELLNNKDIKKKELSIQIIALISAGTLAISPWHIQYSRAGFEATELIFFLLTALYFLLISFKESKYLILSAVCFGLTPWIYSTAKLFTPIFVIFLLFLYKEKIAAFSRRSLILSGAIFAFFVIPMFYTSIFSGGAQRFNYISIFTDPTTEGEISYQRLIDAQVEGGIERNIIEKVTSRFIHNKYVFLKDVVVDNIMNVFSTEFLFIKGDINLRHSIEGVGQFYKIEIIPLVLGSALFFLFFKNKKIKWIIFFWIVVGMLPSVITRDGGTHATRLILILPPLVFLISYGIVESATLLNKNLRFIITAFYILLLFFSFIFYQHLYWIHNPWYSERSWHAGYKEVIGSVKQMESNYDKIVISNANDDPKIFLAAYYPYPPGVWQKGTQKETVDGFGQMDNIGKYYFGQVDGNIGIDLIYKYMGNRMLYIASQREIKGNLISDSSKIPEGLSLVKSIAYPSGEPAFYLFERSKK